jgi:predicted ester cyclase
MDDHAVPRDSLELTYRSWELRHLLIDGPWLAAHLDDTGTTVGGEAVRLREFAVYRFEEGRIASVWGDLDRDRLPARDE